MLEKKTYLAAAAVWDIIYRQEADAVQSLSAFKLLEELFADGYYEDLVLRYQRGQDSHNYVMSTLGAKMNKIVFDAGGNTAGFPIERALRLAGPESTQSAPGFAVYKLRNERGDTGHLRVHLSDEALNFRLKVWQDRPVPGTPSRPIYTIDCETTNFGRPFNTVSFDESEMEAWGMTIARLLTRLKGFIDPKHHSRVDFVSDNIGSLDINNTLGRF